jgi:hypothetical protein
MNAIRASSIGALWGVIGAVNLQVMAGGSAAGLLTISVPFLVLTGVFVSLVGHFVGEVPSRRRLPPATHSVPLTLLSSRSLSIAGLVTLLLPVVLAPRVQDARENARRTQCKNNLWQHSGSHAADFVRVDRDFNILDVSSCPSCSSPGAGIYFIIGSEEPRLYTGFESFVPQAVVVRAQLLLSAYKRGQRYQEIRSKFHREDLPLAAASRP